MIPVVSTGIKAETELQQEKPLNYVNHNNEITFKKSLKKSSVPQ